MNRRVFFALFFLMLTACGSNQVQMYSPRKNSTPNSSEKKDALAPQIVKMPVVISQSGETATHTIKPNEVAVAAPRPAAPLETMPLETKDLYVLVKTAGVSKAKVLEAIAAETELTSINKLLDISATDMHVQPYKTVLFFKAAQIAQKKRQPDLALQYYRAVVSLYPQSAQATKANSEINLILSLEDVDAKVIGAVLPLTGKNANIGQHALNSIRIGLGLNKPNARLRLAVFDTQGSVELATAGVEKLVREDKVIALIGGLSSKEAIAVGQKADLLGVPFIGLSQKSGLTAIGEYVFRNSLTAEMQIDRLVEYAFQKLKAKRFAVLYPNDAYGVEFANIYWDHVLARGGQITAAQTYDPKENDFTTMIQKMTGSYYPEARPDEYKERIKELDLVKKEKAEKNKNKKKNSRVHEVQESILSPIVDFDVLFIPDTGKTLSQVMAFMKVTEVPPLTFLGTNIWNSPDLGKRTGNSNSFIYFVDAIDLNDTEPKETQFFKDYLSEFNEEPTLVEMQVFEAAKILKDLLSGGVSSRESLASNLRTLGRTRGITGELRMSSQRELERPLHILSLDSGTIKKVD